ncbi:MAG TPA: hypothetical protein PLY85_07930 [Anaerolineaceae bacterium]|nr:hypothetical protein [Anaerolineaceae bacterium]
MKLVIIGAGGYRTPLLLKALHQKFLDLGISQIILYDIDQERQKLVKDLIAYALPDEIMQNNIRISGNARDALRGADFVITTFRAGGMEGRILDEQIPLKYGILGQETTGPGGFSMAMRSIPVMLDYVELMRDVCPDAWIINFANPSGLMTEAVLKLGKWEKVIGICDGPESVRLFAAGMMSVDEAAVQLDYFGLNHLGWVRKILINGMDILPAFISQLEDQSRMPGLPFSGWLIKTLGMIPNEYLYYYYYRSTAVNAILQEEKTRGEYLHAQNTRLEKALTNLQSQKRFADMWETYWEYLNDRTHTYMQYASDKSRQETKEEEHLGYANVAYRVIHGLISGEVNALVNVQNQGAVSGMNDEDVVEIPVLLNAGHITRNHIGAIPAHALALMQQVKRYELSVIDAIRDHSYSKSLQALAFHPLVMDEVLARKILDDYINAFRDQYPVLE